MNWSERIAEARKRGKFSDEDKEASMYMCSSYLGEKLGVTHIPTMREEGEDDMSFNLRRLHSHGHDLYMEDDALRARGEFLFYTLWEYQAVSDMGVEVDDVVGVEKLCDDVDRILSHGIAAKQEDTEGWREIFSFEREERISQRVSDELRVQRTLQSLGLEGVRSDWSDVGVDLRNGVD